MDLILVIFLIGVLLVLFTIEGTLLEIKEDILLLYAEKKEEDDESNNI